MLNMNSYDPDLINSLVSKALKTLNTSTSEVEKVCWMLVHEHQHGVMPFEYDIREIDESLYLLVLSIIKEKIGR